MNKEKIILIDGGGHCKSYIDVIWRKKKLINQDKNIEFVFTYLDELIEKQDSPKPRNQIGFKRKTQ